MFEICIDDEGYYTEDITEKRIGVEEMPSVEDVRYLLAYYYNENGNALVLDEEKLEQIKLEISK